MPDLTMAIADIFPLVGPLNGPDYGFQQARDASGVLEFQAESGERFRRQSRPLAWVFDLRYLDRSFADQQAVDAFCAAHAADVFTYRDTHTPRDYTVWLAAQPSYRPVGNERVEIAVQFLEAVGQALLTAPTGPLAAVDPATGVNNGTGVTLSYYGYGFSASAQNGVGNVLVDGQTTGLSLTAPQDFNLPLGYHTVTVQGEFASFLSFSYVV